MLVVVGITRHIFFFQVSKMNAFVCVYVCDSPLRICVKLSTVSLNQIYLHLYIPDCGDNWLIAVYIVFIYFHLREKERSSCQPKNYNLRKKTQWDTLRGFWNFFFLEKFNEPLYTKHSQLLM